MPILLLFSIFYIACRSNEPSTQLQYKKSVEWVHLQQNGDLFVSRWSQSNTGWLQNQGHHTVHLWQKGQSDITAQFHAPHNYVHWNTQSIGKDPQSTPIDVLVVGNSRSTLSSITNIETNSTSLHLENQTHYDDWNLRMYGTWDPAIKTIYTTSATTDTMQEINDTNKSISTVFSISSADIGWLQVGKQSIMLQGHGMLIERETINTVAKTQSIYIFATEFQACIDTVDDMTWGWYTQNNTLYALSRASIIQNDNTLALQISNAASPVTSMTIYIEMHTPQHIGTEEPFSHISTLEKTILSSSFSFSNIFWYKQKATYTIHTNDTDMQGNLWVITKQNSPMMNDAL